MEPLSMGRFSNDWLKSRAGARWFLIAAVLAIIVTPVAFGIVRTSQLPAPWGFLLGLLAVPGAAGGLFLYFGMWAFWARVDQSSRGVKRFWFFAMIVGAWIGSILYFFISYRPRVSRLQERS